MFPPDIYTNINQLIKIYC